MSAEKSAIFLHLIQMAGGLQRGKAIQRDISGGEDHVQTRQCQQRLQDVGPARLAEYHAAAVRDHLCRQYLMAQGVQLRGLRRDIFFLYEPEAGAYLPRLRGAEF